MSPVAPSGRHASRALLISTVAIVVVALALWVAALGYHDKGSFKGVTVAPPVQIGKAKRLAASITSRGPIILGDVSGHLGDPLDVILQHLGTDPDTHWYSFRAQPPQYVGKDRNCTWQWRPAQRSFWASCNHAITTSATGTGLKQYPVAVVNGNVRIDLAVDEPTTTTQPATTTTVIVTGTKHNP